MPPQTGHMINLALNKPASQSSTSQWSSSRAAQEDAQGANNGRISQDFGFHTSREHEPWWQVDLQGEFLVRKVIIFNRQGPTARRLTRFSLLRSLDGRHWKVFFRKIDSTVFGETDDEPYVAKVIGDQPARFVRVRLDGNHYLHFNECQIFGDPLDPAAHERIADEEARAEPERLAVPDGRRGHMADADGFTVFVDDDRYSANIIFALDDGSYEARERRLAAEFINPTDRVIEVGTGIGTVSMTAAVIVGAQNVLTFDANPEIVEDAQQNFRRNGLFGIKSRNGVLKCRATITQVGETAKFHIAKAYWASRLLASPTTPGIIKTVQVPVICLEDEIRSHRANVLICDIEGGEVNLLMRADLTGIRLMIIETHYWAVGEAAVDAMMRKLILDGFFIHLGRSGHHFNVLRRTVPSQARE